MPFFPRILVQLVGLGVVIRQRCAVGGGQGATLDLMPQPEQVLAADAEFAGELGGGHPLGDAAEDQEDLRGAAVGLVELGAGEAVEDPSAGLAAVVEDRGAVAAVDLQLVTGGAAWAGQPVGVEEGEELGVAGVLVHVFSDGKIHDGAPS
jgi:hypothetical protein